MYKKNIKTSLESKFMDNSLEDSGQIIQIVKREFNQVFIIQPIINLWSLISDFMAKLSILGFK